MDVILSKLQRLENEVADLRGELSASKQEIVRTRENVGRLELELFASNCKIDTLEQAIEKQRPEASGEASNGAEVASSTEIKALTKQVAGVEKMCQEVQSQCQNISRLKAILNSFIPKSAQAAQESHQEAEEQGATGGYDSDSVTTQQDSLSGNHVISRHQSSGNQGLPSLQSSGNQGLPSHYLARGQRVAVPPGEPCTDVFSVNYTRRYHPPVLKAVSYLVMDTQRLKLRLGTESVDDVTFPSAMYDDVNGCLMPVQNGVYGIVIEALQRGLGHLKMYLRRGGDLKLVGQTNGHETFFHALLVRELVKDEDVCLEVEMKGAMKTVLVHCTFSAFLIERRG